MVAVFGGCDVLRDLARSGSDGGGATPSPPKARSEDESVLAKSAGIQSVATDAATVYYEDEQQVLWAIPKAGGPPRELGKLPDRQVPLFPIGAAVFAEDPAVVGKTRLFRMTGGTSAALPAEEDVAHAARSPDGRDLFVACKRKVPATDRICVVRSAGSTLETVGEIVAPANRALSNIRVIAVDRTHVWAHVWSTEKPTPGSQTSVEHAQLQRVPRAGGAMEAGTRARGETCAALFADDHSLYCATGGPSPVLQRAQKALDPKWETIAAPPRIDRLFITERFLYIYGMGQGIVRIPKSAPAASPKELERIVEEPVSNAQAIAIEDDAITWATSGELVRRILK